MLDPIANLNLVYLNHLDKNKTTTREQFENLNRFLLNKNCTFNQKSMPSLLKPNFISRKQTQELIYAVEQISSALVKFINLFLNNQEVRKIMNFSEKEEQLFSIDPGYNIPLVISRLDAFLQDYSIRFLEFNCDSPAGHAYSDVMEDGFKELFRDYDFLHHWEIEYFKRQDRLLNALLTCYNEFRNHSSHLPSKPVIAIVDWDDVSTLSEFYLLQKYFGEKGYKTVVCSPLNIRISNGKVLAGDDEIHLIYKRVITRELLERWNNVTGFIRCIKEKKACCCNSFRSYIVGNKKVLSLITDPRFQYIYSKEELNVIQKTIPWTKILADTKETYKNINVHLKDFIIENKDILVLKPSNLYGGKDVYLGCETDDTTWSEVMNAHISDSSWVVQEYIDIPQDIFPEISDDVTLKFKKVNINPFVLLGKYSGTITRVSDNSVINVSAGGGLVPTFSVARKKEKLT
ncbi:MAG: hypothetical protein ABFS16_06675 [Bacteroidota bacterium]